MLQWDMSSYTSRLAAAIAHAPTAKEASAIWGAAGEGLAPSVHEVLGEALEHDRPLALAVCAERLNGRRLTSKQQATALKRWRRTPSAARVIDEAGEYQMGCDLVRLGLIDAHVLVQHKHPSGHPEEHGPIAWAMKGFRRSGADGLLDTLASPATEDLIQALSYCTEKAASSSDKDRGAWIARLNTLLEKGADPNQMEGSRRPTMSRQCASDIAINQAKDWGKMPFSLLVRLLGKRAQDWTTDRSQGHCGLSSWLSVGGSLDVGMEIARGKSIGVEAMQRVLHVLLYNSNQPAIQSDDNVDLFFDGRIQLPVLTPCDVAVAIKNVHSSYYLSTSGSFKPSPTPRLMCKIGEHLMALCPDKSRIEDPVHDMQHHFQENYRKIKKASISTGGVLGLAERARQDLEARVETIVQAIALDMQAPPAPGRGSSPRL